MVYELHPSDAHETLIVAPHIKTQSTPKPAERHPNAAFRCEKRCKGTKNSS